MGISQPHTGFEHIWSVCVGKLEPVQLKVHRECLILFHISFFPSAAKEWHMSVVCPCCLLGKEYLSSSDRCWHYHPDVLPGTGTWPVHRHGLTGASTRQRRQTAVHWFWMGKMATLILAGADDDVVIMVPVHTASQKNWFFLSAPCQRHKKEGELTGLIYGPLVNDDTPSTPFHTMPVHDTSISINSHHPSKGSQSPEARQHGLKYNPTTKQALFLLSTNYFFCWAGGCCCCGTFNLILFLILISPKHWPGTTIVLELRNQEYSEYSLALCHSISANTTQYHFFPSLHLSVNSWVEI